VKRPYKLERDGRVQNSFTTCIKAYLAFKRLRDAYLCKFTWRIRNADTGDVWELWLNS
jgi:hypothetical protein